MFLGLEKDYKVTKCVNYPSRGWLNSVRGENPNFGFYMNDNRFLKPWAWFRKILSSWFHIFDCWNFFKKQFSYLPLPENFKSLFLGSPMWERKPLYHFKTNEILRFVKILIPKYFLCNFILLWVYFRENPFPRFWENQRKTISGFKIFNKIQGLVFFQISLQF